MNKTFVIAKNIISKDLSQKLEQVLLTVLDNEDSYDKVLLGIILRNMNESIVSQKGEFIISDIRNLKAKRKGRDKVYIFGEVFALMQPDYKKGYWKSYEFGYDNGKMRGKIK